MEYVRSQHQAPAVTTAQGARWAPELISMMRRRKKISATARIWTPDIPAHSLVTILTVPSQLRTTRFANTNTDHKVCKRAFKSKLATNTSAQPTSNEHATLISRVAHNRQLPSLHHEQTILTIMYSDEPSAFVTKSYATNSSYSKC